MGTPSARLRPLALAACLVTGACGGDAGPAATADSDTGGLGDVAADASEVGTGADAPEPQDAGDVAPAAADASAQDADLAAGDELRIAGLDSEVRVLRDDLGIPHIHAATEHDLFFAQAYVHCLDRFPQMELLRRVGTGRLAELVYGLSADSVVDDAMTRTMGFLRVAEQQLAGLEAGGEAQRALTAYAEGVNAFIAEVRSGERTLPTPYSFVIKPDVLSDWTPVDTLAIGRVQAHDLAFDGFREIGHTETAQAMMAAFPPGSPEPARAARAGYVEDLFRHAPADRTVQHEDYAPILPTALFAPTGPGSAAAGAAERPMVPGHLLERAARMSPGWQPLLARLGVSASAGGASNSWAVHGTRTTSGHPMVCNDPHLSLPNPPLFHLAHLVLEGDIDAIGGNFPGVPGLLIGHNRNVAWTLTTANNDRSDAYLEDFVAGVGGAAPTVMVDGQPAAVTVISDTVGYGSLGQPIGSLDFEIHLTPKGRVMLPDITPEGQVPLETGPQLSFAWTGFEPTPEINAVVAALRATSADALIEAYDQFHVANQNITGADVDGNIFATTAGAIPIRGPGAFSYDAILNPGGTAPWWVLPGDDDADWIDMIPADQGPRSKNPGKGFVVTANNDHVGQVSDGDPANEPFYIGYDYATGFRAGRITRLIDGSGVDSPAAEDALLGLPEMTRIQTDTRSNMAERLRGPLLADLSRLVEELEAPGTHAALTELAEANAASAATVAAAYSLLEAWDGETPAGLDALGEPDGDGLSASAASLWNHFVVALIDQLLGDEREVMGARASDRMTTNGLVAIVENDPGELATMDPTTGESILWDRFDTEDRQETRAETVGAALLAALEASDARYGDVPLDERPWGEVHGLNLGALVPLPGGGGDLPAPDHPRNSLGYPRPGDQWAVNVCNHGLTDTDFRCGAGAIMRFCVEMDPSGPRAMIMLPGGQSMDASSPYYNSLLDDWLDHEPREWPFAAADVTARAEDTLTLRPTEGD